MKLKAIRNLLYLICRVIIITLFFVIGAVIIQVVFSGREITPEKVYKAITAGFVAGMSVQLIVVSIAVAVGLTANSRRAEYLKNNGYCDGFYNKIKKKLDTKNDKKRLKYSIFYAEQLCDGEKYEQAVEVIKSIDVKSVNQKLMGKYYSAYFYVLVMSQNTDDAKKLLDISDGYAYKTHRGFLALGIYNYAIGEYAEAEDLLLDTSIFAPRYVKDTASLYIALCYLKCDKKQEAKEIVCELIPGVYNPVVKSNLSKLMKLVERAYGVGEKEEINEKAIDFITDNEEEILQDAGSID